MTDYEPWAGLAFAAKEGRREVATRKAMVGCFGRSAKTGKQVGARHRWPAGWGRGLCEWCNRPLESLMIDEHYYVDTGESVPTTD